MLRLLAIPTTLALILSACASAPQPSASKLDGGCEAMRGLLPMPFRADRKTGHTGGPGEDQPDTVARIRAVNAAFRAACP